MNNEMRKTDFLIDALFLFLCQIIACLVSYFAAWMLVLIVNRVADVGAFVNSIIYSVVLFVGVGGLICVYNYYTGYRTLSFNGTASVIAAAISTAVHLLIAALFNYVPLLSGCALPLARAIILGQGYGEEELQIPSLLPFFLFLATMILFHAVSLVLKKIAINKRLIDRYELTGSMEIKP